MLIIRLILIIRLKFIIDNLNIIIFYLIIYQSKYHDSTINIDSPNLH